MNNIEVSEMLASNISKIKSEKVYRNIIAMNNNLIRFDYLNRIMIAIQCDNAFDTRTYSEWSNSDRDIINRDKKIAIVLPVTKTVYIDNETNEMISQSDLNINELPFALKYNIIRKEENVDTIDIVHLYDIRNTYCKDNSKYKVDKQALSSSKILNMTQQILGCTIEKSELTYYSSSKNILYVANVSYNELAESISSIIISYYLNDKIKNSIEISEMAYELLTETVKYSMCTMLHIDACSDFSSLKQCSLDEILQVLNLDEQIIDVVYTYLGFENQSLNIDATHSIVIKKKASALLDLMEANEEYLKLKGK